MFVADYVHCLCIPLWLKPQEFRRKFNIRGNGCTDCLASYFCHSCALSQLNTELKARAEQPQIEAKEAPMGYVQPAPPHGMMYVPPL
ncbi:hypothetical protein LTR78_006979 [Recurvomyces mirabilis]|uniref:PLAC8 family protein n=1 Tax=Recurvomyces mirabilis TaxID=574656 RepID=A0AAE0WK08_9PEZI|nr:hypothetical protein LTR78_006979 [Recurvomyces mirabilis]KAK5153363.1 hypothetical protein LTS14_007532 [Recurvomyces mirabilis]